MDFNTGDVKWSDKSLGQMLGVVCRRHDLLPRRERPDQPCRSHARWFQTQGPLRSARPQQKNSWPYLVIANGMLYVRDQDVLLCYDVREKK